MTGDAKRCSSLSKTAIRGGKSGRKYEISVLDLSPRYAMKSISNLGLFFLGVFHCRVHVHLLNIYDV